MTMRAYLKSRSTDKRINHPNEDDEDDKESMIVQIVAKACYSP